MTQGDLTRSITVEAAGRGRRAQGQHQPDDREPPRDHQGQRGAGLAEDEPRADLGHAPGPARPRGRDPADHERGHAGRQRPARRVLPRRARRLARRGRAAPRRLLRLQAARRAAPTASRSARGSSARPRVEGKTIRLTDVPHDYIKIASALGEATPAHLVVMPVMFEEQVLGVIELGALRPLQRGQPGLPGPARGHHRRGHQHDPGQHAHRAAADAVPGADPGAAEAVARAAPDQRRAAGQGARAASSRTATSRSRTPRSSSPARASRRRPPSSP